MHSTLPHPGTSVSEGSRNSEFTMAMRTSLWSNIDYPTTSGQWPMDRCSDKGNVPDKENVNVCSLYVPRIEGYRKSRLVMSLSYLYTHPYSPHKQYKHYKYDVLVMSCIIMHMYTHHGKCANIMSGGGGDALLDPSGVPDN